MAKGEVTIVLPKLHNISGVCLSALFELVCHGINFLSLLCRIEINDSHTFIVEHLSICRPQRRFFLLGYIRFIPTVNGPYFLNPTLGSRNWDTSLHLLKLNVLISVITEGTGPEFGTQSCKLCRLQCKLLSIIWRGKGLFPKIN